MNAYQPKPGDVILMESEEVGFYRKLKDWLLGSKWNHIAIFFDMTKRGLPLIIESIGRGVVIRALNSSEGKYALILRHEDENTALRAAAQAERIADNPGSWYNFWAIPRFILPRLIWYKLTSRRFGFGYRYNPHFICSELVDAAYNRLVPSKLGPPLPHDFLEVKELRPFWEGRLAFR